MSYRLKQEIHRFYDGYGPRYSPRGERYYPERRRPRPLSRIYRTPLQLLVLLGVGAALAQFVPSLLCMLLQFGTILAVGVVCYWVWQLFRRH
jgi:hypothetical protein